MPDRIEYLACDALTIDLGEAKYDLVFISTILHHFNELENKSLCERAARSLRYDGIIIIKEFVRPHAPESRKQAGQSLDLFFALTSKSGTWCIDELTRWQKSAGQSNKKPVFLRSIPGFVQTVAEKKYF